MQGNVLVATDLDRTLLPNGNQEYDGSMKIFNRIIKNERLKLAYVTGRNLKLVMDAMKEFRIPMPDFIVAEVGTVIYRKKGNIYVPEESWVKNTSNIIKKWNTDIFKGELDLLKGLRLQEVEKQNEFKLSYYVDNIPKAESVVKEVIKIMRTLCNDAIVVYSFDEKNKIGLLDILPKYATKLSGVEYIRKELALKKEDIIYCGDSGNDILPLTFGYRSILVRNAIDEVKNAVKQICIQQACMDRIYIAEGYKKLNGYYVSGIIEGLIKYNIISSKYAD